MKSYLGRVEGTVAQMKGTGCHDLSDALGRRDYQPWRSAADFPVRLVESGPAGGRCFRRRYRGALWLGQGAESFDMGGTTAKICLIKDQTPKTARVFEVARTYRFQRRAPACRFRSP